MLSTENGSGPVRTDKLRNGYEGHQVLSLSWTKWSELHTLAVHLPGLSAVVATSWSRTDMIPVVNSVTCVEHVDE